MQHITYTEIGSVSNDQTTLTLIRQDPSGDNTGTHTTLDPQVFTENSHGIVLDSGERTELFGLSEFNETVLSRGSYLDVDDPVRNCLFCGKEHASQEFIGIVAAGMADSCFTATEDLFEKLVSKYSEHIISGNV